MIILVMGVSGCGKSTVGARLAAALRLPFADADDHHPASNRAKMAAGRALDDADRAPWLRALNRLLIGYEFGSATGSAGGARLTGDADAVAHTNDSASTSASGISSRGLPLGDDASAAGMAVDGALGAAARGGDAHSAATDSSDTTLGRGAVLACSALKAAYRDILFCGLVDQPPGVASPADHMPDSSVTGAMQPTANQTSQPAPTVVVLFLRGTAGVIGERMRARTGHFMPPSLLASQFAALEPPVASRSSDDCHTQRVHPPISADDGASQRVSAPLADATTAATVIPLGQPRVLVADIDSMTVDETVQWALVQLAEL